MSYINPSPGNTGEQIVVKIKLDGSGNTTANIVSVPALQNMTVNNTTDVFSWSQLDNASKLQVPTTATNSVAMNIVLDHASFFGSNGNISGATIPLKGIMGVSKSKELVEFSIRASAASGNAVFIQGSGYVTNLAPAVTAEQPVFVSPMTLAVTGDYTVAESEVAADWGV
jgi:hypothetical protein